MQDRIDIHQKLTDQIVQAIEAGAGDFQMPWHTNGARRPINIASQNPYNGVNVLALWVQQQVQGYGSHVWGTYRQWAARGAQVRKGAKAAHVVFYKELEIDAEDDSGPALRMFARATPVFNADQVEGLDVAEVSPPTTGALNVPSLDAFAAKTGAVIQHQGVRAFYSPGADAITLPPPERFTGSPTSTATEAYYSTLLHELTHWTGHASRLDRDLANRFGSAAYAMEELVAELGAAFLCADLGLTVEPRPDHAQYVASWLKVLKDDKKAIFTAAAKASAAAGYLMTRGS